MKHKKILHVVRPAQGGIKVHLQTLLAGLGDRYQLYLAAPPDEDLVGSLRPLVERVYPIPIAEGLNPARDLRIIRSLIRIVRSEGIDLIHTHGVRAGILGETAALLNGTRVVATIHNSQEPQARFFKAFRLIQTLLFQKTDQIITVSRALSEEIVRYERVTPERITVIYNGIELERYTPRWQGAGYNRALLDCPEGVPVVGTVARLEPRKGVSTLIEAMAQVNRDYGPACLVITGDGPERPNLEAQVSRLGLSDRVLFTGFRNDIPQILPLFDLVVIPSVQEGLSIFCIEALASGCPVIASQVGGLPEIIEDGRTGLLVPPADPKILAEKISYLLADRSTAGRLGREGYELVARNFTREKMLEQTATVYDRVLGQDN